MLLDFNGNGDQQDVKIALIADQALMGSTCSCSLLLVSLRDIL